MMYTYNCFICGNDGCTEKDYNGDGIYVCKDCNSFSDAANLVINAQKIITAQASTIERLADALEFALARGETGAYRHKAFHKYADRRWPQGWTFSKLSEELQAARALLAEIRGAK